ncbi:MAG: methyltransferase domain-containing protein [Verrucomicrobia bacterium]|nr:methyltransferase domain-containing protein [Verrucomicrobiota bacterium]
MSSGYIHTFSVEEQARLVAQAAFLEPYIFPTIDFSGCARVLEVGCGVGAELQILRRRLPQLHLTGLDFSESQLARARELLRAELAAGAMELHAGSAYELPFADASFDGVCLIWVLEHLAEPARALREARRVLRPGGTLSVTEVFNAGLHIEPPCPAMAEYWRAFNTLQRQLGGAPDVGAELGELVAQAGFGEIQIRPLPVRMDEFMPDAARRREFIGYWQTLWLSGAAQLLERGAVPPALVDAMQTEFAALAENKSAIFDYSARQVQARQVGAHCEQ